MLNKILLCACILLLMENVLANPYDLENCDTLNLGFIDVPSTSIVTVRAGTRKVPIPNPCRIKFRAKDAEHVVKVSIVFLRLTDCTVNIIFRYGSQSSYFKCGDANPGEIFTNEREVTIEMTKSGNSGTYNVEFQLSTVKPVITVPGDNSSPTQVGLIIGIVGGVFLFLLFIAILAVCCHKRARRNKALYGQKYPTKKGLDNHEPHHTVGYTNDVVSNGVSPEESPRAKTKLLSEPDGGRGSPHSNRPRNLNFSRTGQMSIKEMHTSPKKSTASYDFDKEDDDDPYDKMDDRQRPPKSPFLGALHSNAKFRRSFAENERDAEDRANRMSTGSSLGSSGASLDAPPLPSVPNVPKSPGNKKKNHASIRRNPRPTSSSEEEFNQINGDRNIRVIRDNKQPSPSEFVPVKTQDPQKADTRHTLRPSKGKSSTDKGHDLSNKKDRRLEDFEPNSGNQNGNFQKNTARLSKRAQKSPRLGSNSQGFSHRRGRSVGDDGSRPGTPTSMVDLESLPPLQRSASRQSLYASRSSLYRRRGRRDSYAESVITCRDDISIGRHSRSYSQAYDDDESDGYEKPISRREKERMFRSLGDLGRETKERSTQTLRETATQTGHEQSVIMQPKRVVQRKKRSKSLSAVGTQTSKEKDTSKTREKKEEKGKSESDKNEHKVKSNSDKNSKEETKEKETTDKPKPKPKPKPRKSQGSVSAVAQSEDSDDGGKRRKKKKRKEKSTENNTSGGTAHPDKPPMVPQPQVPGQNVVIQDPVTGQFIQYPPGTMHPQQMVQGGYPAVVQPGYPIGIPQQPGTLPYNQVPQGYIAQGQSIPPQQPAHIPGKPRKSNWEMLCEMTEGKRPAAMSDATSVVSSVFTSNVPSQPGYVHNPYANSAGAHPANVIMPQTETLPRVPPTYTEVVGADAYSGPPSGPPSGIHNYSNSGSASLSGSDTGPPVHIVHNDTANLLPKKSSWEVLQEITDRQKASESMV